ncbi:alginate export family protein [Aurantibacter crassamenti]|uniref:alginate export family protein n=1 Tax=Aurantibacter crassamenti TaxID=1837375 RepID=UPI001939B397|nr:alginate export family protein [Aurantibacter crassamenti]MBM1107753.1 alginate export family protein [Aurantibacter crassamenti]
MKNQYIILLLLLLSFQIVTAQFTLDGEFKPRTEFRSGFGSIIPDAADSGFAIATRLRLNAGYQYESFKFYMSLQDVMVWGENRQLKPEDSNNSFSVFQAWADIKLGEGFSTKIGRQMLVYDDQRILGGVDWAMQARNHDAALLKYKKGKFMLDLALAFNQDFSTTTGNPGGFQSVGTTYNTTGFFSYKTMQFLYLKQNWDTFSASALIMNNGFQNFTGDPAVADGVSNLLTLGTHLNYKQGSFGAVFNGYLQSGERQNSVDVSGAYLLGLDLSYKVSKGVSLGLGAEIISGNDTATTDKTEAFFPLYGTNHKFNGFMDYFYVGNHANSVGLTDIHASAKFAIGKSSSLLVKVLNFSGAQELASGEKSLGTELDLVFAKKFKGYGLAIGYSQMFASNGMYELKGISESAAASSQNWAWVQLTMKPKFLNTGVTN